MTDNAGGDHLEELETLQDEVTTSSPSALTPEMEAALTQMRSGLPAPFYNRAASRDYYRMLFGGVLMFAALIAALRYNYVVARRALDATLGFAIGIVVLDFVVSLTLALSLDALFLAQ